MDKYTKGFSLEEDSGASAYSFNGPNSSFADHPEAKRRKRVASYNVLAAEGRVKESVRSGFKWLKSKYSEMRYGW